MFSIAKIIIPILYIIALSSILLTAHIEGYEMFLKEMTQENGFFETLSVLLLLIISFYGIICSFKNRKLFNGVTLTLVLGFALVAFLAGMEEISWGQQLFHFESGEFFMEKNLQKETNLHNLMDANLFSSIIYSTVYSFLVFAPLLYKIFKTSLKKFKLLSYFDINPHTILVVLFASVFQIYFYNDMGVWFDMFSHLGALGLFGYFLYTQKSELSLKIHYIFIVLSTIISMWSFEIYRFQNMQYEIRESFVVLASLLIFVELVEREKSVRG